MLHLDTFNSEISIHTLSQLFSPSLELLKISLPLGETNDLRSPSKMNRKRASFYNSLFLAQTYTLTLSMDIALPLLSLFRCLSLSPSLLVPLSVYLSFSLFPHSFIVSFSVTPSLSSSPTSLFLFPFSISFSHFISLYLFLSRCLYLSLYLNLLPSFSHSLSLSPARASSFSLHRLCESSK